MAFVQRRIAALIVLLVAFGLAVLPRMLRAEIPGTAGLAAVPLPPPVGSCVNLEPGRLVVVDCSSLHDGEVVLAWPGAPAGRSSVIEPGECQAMVEPYPVDDAGEQITGHWFVRTGWVLVPGEATAEVARAPANTVGTRYEWSVCMITAGAPYAGRIGGPTTVTPLPGAFRSCEGATGPVPCVRPHRSERLADKWGVLPDTSTTNADREQQVREVEATSCRQFAAGVTAAPDPTRGGRLTVEVVVDDIYFYSDPLRPHDRTFAFDAGCVISSDRPLTETLVGYGPGSLPYA